MTRRDGTRIKRQMLLGIMKDYLLYRIPNAVLRMAPNGNLRCEYIYERIKSEEQYKIGTNNLIKMFVSSVVSFICAPIVIIYLFVRVFVLKQILLHRVEVCITTYCSLKCKHCSNLMQYYSKPYHLDAGMIKESLNNLLKLVDSLENVVFLGGEPFVHPEFTQLLEFAIKEKKIKNIKIITNGVIGLSDQVIELLKDKKVFVSVSDYGIKKEHVDRTCELLEINSIGYVRVINKKWYDFGNLDNKNRDVADIKDQYHKCSFKCKCILNGKLYVCPRASHGSDLEYYQDTTYVDLLGEDRLENRLEKLLKVYYCDHFIEACKYCDGGTDLMQEVICGEQI